MAFDEHLAERISMILKDKNISFEVKRMMGGLCFMVDDKMCIGISKYRLIARIDPKDYDKFLKRKGSEEMKITGRPMRGFIFVNPVGIDSELDLEFWVGQCIKFNPKAKRRRK